MSTTVGSESVSLTTRQREWLAHLAAWREQGGTLKDYATAHDLPIRGLYTARRLLMQRGAWPPSQRKRAPRANRPTLIPLRMNPMPAPPAMFRIVLPNGVILELPEHAEPQRWRTLLDWVTERLR